MDLRRAVRFDDWANREALKALIGDDTPAQATNILAHIVAVNHLWLSRAAGAPAPASMWPEWTLSTIEEEMESCLARWQLCLNSGHVTRGPLEYLSSKGKPCSNSLEELVLEVLCHSAHHRGQIALMLRQNGFPPPASTDFIPALRAECF
jgi:uncharacterized damage-inducible protein DinB